MQNRTNWTIAGAALGGILVAGFWREKRRSKQKEQTTNRDVRVLIVGAGAIGSTYACHLSNRGLNVTLLATDDRFQHLIANGVRVQNLVTRARLTGTAHVTSAVPTQGEFDLVILAVRYDQLCGALESVQPFTKTTPLLLLQNNLMGVEGTIKELNGDPFLMGFPGTAGIRIEGTVCSLPLWCGTTLIGEPQGIRTQRLHQTAFILRRAGLRVKVRDDILPWLRTHATMITVLAGYIYKNTGSIRQFARREGQIRLCQEALSEALHIIEMSDRPITPSIRHNYETEAQWLSRIPVQLASLTSWGRLLVDGYAAEKADELQLFYDQLLTLAELSDMRAPNLQSLAPYFG